MLYECFMSMLIEKIILKSSYFCNVSHDTHDTVTGHECESQESRTFEIEKSKKSNGASNGFNLIHPVAVAVSRNHFTITDIPRATN